MELGGLHHVTAVTTQAKENVAFYTQVLGMRLVKKTVNQDDVSAYHLFYGDELGNPGTEFTFFDWPHLRVAPNHAGAGEVSATELRVAGRDALAYWTQRLDEFGVPHAGIEERGGRSFVAFRDPEGQRLRLSDDSGSNEAPGTPWDGNGVPVEFGVRGLGTFDLAVREAAPTVWVLTEVMGFRPTTEYDEAGERVREYEVGPGGAGARVRLIEKPDAPAAHLGRGGVHHVAFRVPDDEQHEAWRKHLRASGIGVTPRIDRFYFRAIYFREPGGILFEISTDGPGFATDEDAAHLGERLSLPPFLEDRREEIEGRLTPIG
ncbi:MAG: ring-cleaving dioxygenase [Rubrobacteraceae bacterium]